MELVRILTRLEKDNEKTFMEMVCGQKFWKEYT